MGSPLNLHVYIHMYFRPNRPHKAALGPSGCGRPGRLPECGSLHSMCPPRNQGSVLGFAHGRFPTGVCVSFSCSCIAMSLWNPPSEEMAHEKYCYCIPKS